MGLATVEVLALLTGRRAEKAAHMQGWHDPEDSGTSPDDDLATLARAEEGRRGEVDVSPATEGAA